MPKVPLSAYQAAEEEIDVVKRSGSTKIAHVALKHRISQNHKNKDTNVLQRAYQAAEEEIALVKRSSSTKMRLVTTYRFVFDISSRNS